MKGARLINRFPEKIVIWANEPFYAKKIAHPHNSGSAGRTFLKFCTMKATNSQMKMISINLHTKKFGGGGGGKFTQLDPKMGHPPKFGSAVTFFCKFCTMKRANNKGPKGQMKVIIIVCTKTNLAHPDNSEAALRIVLKFCRMKGAYRYMKILLFFEKKN